MKTEVNENDVIKHWGIYNNLEDVWLTDESGLIFAVTCPRVANAQYDIIIQSTENSPDYDQEQLKTDLQVKEII